MADSTWILKVSSPDAPAPLKQDVARVLAKLAPLVAARVKDKQHTDFRLLVDAFMRGVELRPLDIRRAELQARALQAVLEGAEWLTAEQIGELGKFSASNPAARANRWKQDGKLFAIQHDGLDRFARYALDETYRPIPIAGEVLACLGPIGGWRIASWFESTSAWLAGARPRELLAIDPAAVLHAAKQYRSSGTHG